MDIIIGAAIGFIISLILQRLSYKDEYYKKIIDKRIENYENLEALARQLKLWLEDDSGRLYHSIFHNWDTFEKFYTSLLILMANELWFSKKTVLKLRDLNRQLWMIHTTNYKKDISAHVGIVHYDKFLLFSQEIENLLYNDFKKLHRISSFIREKKYDPYKK